MSDPAIPALALCHTERPHNLGAAIRLCACLGVELHLIEPLGFPLSSRRIREAALDYATAVTLRRHADPAAFAAWLGGSGRRPVVLSSQAARAYHEARFTAADLLLVGSEGAGVPAELRATAALAVRVPLRPGLRSLNLVTAAAIVLGEALRQTGGYGPPVAAARAEGAREDG
jgi:tRNA (cytidine/uridine-2'-O-)-methyltransferase